ncbi:MAG: hypothetical protein AB1Z98_22590 [Nannocystaceae bacterium]
MIDGTPMVAAVLAAAAACGRPDVPSEHPPSAGHDATAGSTETTLRQCPRSEIAFRREFLPEQDVLGQRPASATAPWSALPGERPAAPWIDTRHGLLVLPRPSAAADGPARWDVLSSRTGVLITSFEIADPAALPPDAAQWLAGHGLLDDLDEAPLRSMAVPAAGSRQRRLDEPTGWSLDSGPTALGDADIDPYFVLEIPGRCRWPVTVGDEASTKLLETEIEWALHATSMWVAPDAGVAVLTVVYRGEELDPSGMPTSVERFALSYRVLGGAQ